MKKLKVALVADGIIQYGGAEKVLQRLLEVYPDATVFTSISDPNLVEKEFKGVNIKNSFLQIFPFKHHKQFGKLLLLLYPLAYRLFPFFGFDVVISISAHFSKFVKPWSSKTKHITYILTPPRWLWMHDSRSIKNDNSFLFKFYSFFIGSFFEKIWQNWDRNAARRADRVISIAKTVQDRVKNFYDLDSDIIYPPVDVKKIKVNKDNYSREKWLLYVGRLERYKGVHLLIAACAVTKTPLKIAGKGSELENLKQLVTDYNAKGLVKFIHFPSDDEVRELIYRCRALVCPIKDEDFGIVPVEGNAAGAPVIAYRSGGVMETISENNPKTGIFFDTWDSHSLADAILDFDPDQFDPMIMRKHAEQFSSEIFKYKFKNYIEDLFKENK